MAFTERYVTVTGAGAHNGTTEADAWSFAEMITAAPAAGTRVNMKSGSYSEGVRTIPAGTAAALFILRGYNTTIGDLDVPSRAADGSLITTNMPDLTITGAWVPSIHSVIQNIDITGALSSALINSTTMDHWSMINCRVVNTQNNANAKCIAVDDYTKIICCDFDCTGAAHAATVDIDSFSTVIGCRFHTTSTSACLQINGGVVINSVFYGNAASDGILISVDNEQHRIIGCTFYNIGRAISLPNSVNTASFLAYDNHCTGCTDFIENLYTTAAKSAIIVHNRIRDNSANLTLMEAITFGDITSDDVDATDFVNAGSADFRLKAGAPAKANGLTKYTDIGAYQREESGARGYLF